jgi:MAF protein
MRVIFMSCSEPQPSSIPPRRLVLSSTSPFRRALLERLGFEFETISPEVDETAQAGESPGKLVTRLAEAKARAGAGRFPDALVIGSDQIACIEGDILGKPGAREQAIDQLRKASGKKVTFYTGLCLLDAGKNQIQVECIPFHVHFRSLSRAQIEAYVDREKPFNCAGSFKSEGLGIALFERLEGDDPNALIGLPLIRLVAMLETAGFKVLG